MGTKLNEMSGPGFDFKLRAAAGLGTAALASAGAVAGAMGLSLGLVGGIAVSAVGGLVGLLVASRMK